MVYLSSQAADLGHHVFWLAQLLAVFPFRLKQDGLFLDPVLLVYAMVMKLALGIHILFIEIPALGISAVVAYCSIVLHSVIVLSKKDALNTFLKLLSDCEFGFLQLGKKSLIKTNSALDYLLIVLSALTALLDSTFLQDVNVSIFLKMWLRLSVLEVVHPFFHLVVAMQRRFSDLNEMIGGPSESKAPRFRQLSELHQRCVSACHVLNDCFTQQVLWVTGDLFLYLTFTSYNVFTVIEEDAGFFEIGIQAFCLVYFISIAFLICAACEKTSAEAKKFDILLHRLMIADVKGELVADEKLFLHIAMRQEICFSASNVFTLDYTLIRSMISAATTYLVILIQMTG